MHEFAQENGSGYHLAHIKWFSDGKNGNLFAYHRNYFMDENYMHLQHTIHTLAHARTCNSIVRFCAHCTSSFVTTRNDAFFVWFNLSLFWCHTNGTHVKKNSIIQHVKLILCNQLTGKTSIKKSITVFHIGDLQT